MKQFNKLMRCSQAEVVVWLLSMIASEAVQIQEQRNWLSG